MAVLCFLSAAGCKRQEIRTEQIPKELALTVAAPKVSWKLPVGWIEKTASGMRVGSFTVAGTGSEEADVSIIPLEGIGATLDNVNRWRGQVGIAPLSPNQLDSQTQKAEVGTATGVLVDVQGTDPQTQKPTGIFGAMLAQGNTTWFFKMIGPDKLVAAQKPAFLEFLKSIRFTSASGPALAAAPPAAPAPTPEKIPTAPPAVSAPTTSGSGTPSWQVPPGWNTSPPGQMVLARFAVGVAGSGGPEITVTVLEGIAGGVLANVNRWRGQLALPSLAEGDLPKATSTIDIGADKSTLFEVAGSNQRLVAVIVPHGGKTWFFKLLGPDTAVASEKAAFLTFVRSVRFP